MSAPVISEKELEAAAEIAKQEGTRGFNVPKEATTVTEVHRSPLPFVFNLKFDAGRGAQVLVVDGHVVKERSLNTLSSYFRRIGLLEQRDWTFEDVATFLNNWGGPPLGFNYIVTSQTGPNSGDAAGMKWSSDHIDLVAYWKWQPATGGRRTFDTWLRAKMRIDRSYELNWTVEKLNLLPGKKWEPFKGV